MLHVTPSGERSMAEKRTPKPKMGRRVRYSGRTNRCEFLLDDASEEYIAAEASRLSCSRSDALVELIRRVRRCPRDDR